MSDILLHEVKGKSEIITFNNPNKLNVLSDEMLELLLNALEKSSSNPKTKVVIIKSTGKAFCAGHDLKEMQNARINSDQGIGYFKDLFKRCSKVMLKIKNLSKPVIAEVQGIATAAGCQLVATCDIAIASKNASFGVNGVNIGLFCSTPMVALSRNISRKQAFEMLTTGEFITADQAKTLGLVNRVASIDKFEAETEDLAEKIASKLGAAVKIGKEAFYKQLEMPIIEAYEYTGQVMAENMMLRQTEKGIDAFLNKLEPAWEQD